MIELEIISFRHSRIPIAAVTAKLLGAILDSKLTHKQILEIDLS